MKDDNNYDEDNDEMKNQRIDREVRYFNMDYPFFRPFYYLKTREKAQSGLDDMSIDKSFLMLLILIIFYILNLVFIYSARSIISDSMIIEFLDKEINLDNVSNLDELKSFLIQLGQLLIIPDVYYLNNTYSSLTGESLDRLLSKSWDDQEQFLQNVSKMEPVNISHVSTRVQFENYIKQATRLNFHACSSLHFIFAEVNQSTDTGERENATKIFFQKGASTNTARYWFSPYFDPSKARNIQNMKFIGERKRISKDNPYYGLPSTMLENTGTFKTGDQAGLKYTVKFINIQLDLMTGYYDGTGYHYDFPTYSNSSTDSPSYNPNYVNFSYPYYELFIQRFIPTVNDSSVVDNLDETQNYYFIVSRNTRCLTVLFTIYFWQTDQFANVMMVHL